MSRLDWSSIRSAFRITRYRPDPGSDVDAELAFHFERVIADLAAKGMPLDDARREARRRFGSVGRYRRELESLGRGTTTAGLRRVAATVGATLSFALRGLLRSPGLSAAVVATLSLGIGVNVAMFRLVDGLLLSPPPHVEDADRVRALYFERWSGPERATWMATSYSILQDVREVGAFESVAAHLEWDLVVGEGAEAGIKRLKAVSQDYFSLLGASAAMGRGFAPEDHRTEAEPTTVLSWELWDRAFGRAPSVVGTTLQIGTGRYRVVGIAPRGFTGADLAPVDLWLPLEQFATAELSDGGWRESRGMRLMRLVAKLVPAVSEDAALDEATAAYRAGGPATDSTTVAAASLVPGDSPMAGEEVSVAGWLGAISVFVLLIACANVANLLLTRNLRRRRELAVRATLGIGRRRLVAQLMTEAGILALLGGAAAIALGGWVGRALYRTLLPDIALSASISDPRLLVFTAIAATFTAVAAGVIPAIQSSGVDLVTSLKSGGQRTGVTRTRTQAGLLVLQVTLSVVLLTGASVFVRSLTRLQSVDLGFDTADLSLVVLSVEGVPASLFMGERDEGWPPNEMAGMYEQVEERLASLPGVGGATMVNPTPFRFVLSLHVEVPGLDSLPGPPAQGPFPLAVSSSYFEVMGLELLTGRGIEPEDDRFGASQVVVANATMAGLLWPGENPLGRCIRIGSASAPCTTVIGVVEDSHFGAVIEDGPRMIYYLPIRQQILGGAPTNIFIRSENVDAAAIREAAMAVSPRIRFATVEAWNDVTAQELRPWTLGATVFAAFGVLALIVAALGLYAVFAFDVAGRSRELGIRSALGATRRGLFGMVVRDVAILSGVGIALGVFIVAAARRWIDPLLYETSAIDAGSLLAVGILFAVVALVAAAGPGGRAARADPLDAIRTE